MDRDTHTQDSETGRRFSLFAFLAALPQRLAAWLGASLFGRFFCGYAKAEELLAESRTARAVSHGRLRKKFSHYRYRIATLVSKSRVLVWLHRIFTVLQQTKLRAYGVFFITFGGYACLFYTAEYFVLPTIEPNISVLITGIVAGLMGLPLLFGSQTLHESLDEGKFLGAFLYRVAGLRIYAGKHESKWQITPMTAFLLGSLFGVVSFFSHPLYLLVGLFAIAFFVLLLHSPEFSLLSAIFLAPFLIFVGRPSVLLLIILLIGVAGYIGKLILGRRNFRFGPVDCGILALMVMHLLSCFFTRGGSDSVLEALLSLALMCGYFLAANLISTPAMIDRTVSALLSSAAIVALVGVLQQLTGQAVSDWLDSAAYDYIGGRITSTFTNPNVLAVFLILILPFAVARMAQGSAKSRFHAGFTFVLLMAALVFTWSRGAWISAILSLILFVLICHPSAMYILLPLGIALPFALSAWLPSIAERLFSSVSLSDSSVFYRSELWQGVWGVIGDNFIGGIGVGEAAFSAVYPYYAHAGIESATHAHNLYLQYFASFGFLGPLLLIFVLLLVFCCLFTHRREERNQNLHLLCIATACSLTAVLANGFTDYVFYNHRIFFLFFVVCGIGVALKRVGHREHLRSIREEGFGAYAYTVEVELIDG